MGHYASEVDPDWGKDDDVITNRLKAGYTYVLWDEFYTCGQCFAIVAHDSWEQHSEWHKTLND